MLPKRTWATLSMCLLAGCGARMAGAEGEIPAQSSEPSQDSEVQDLDSEVQVLDSEGSPGEPEVLAAHNRARVQHCAPPLTWSDELAQVAAGWANELQSRGCPLEHSQGAYGENLFMATAGTQSASAAVGVWVDERDAYRFAQGGFSMQTGHFTQVVWAATQHVGCANLECDGMDLWVCNYDPPGNVEGQYRENVLPQTCSR